MSVLLPTIIVERRSSYGIEYDADNEAILNSGKPMPVMKRQLREMMRQYEDTLSQPIAITGWQGNASTWEVYFTRCHRLPPTAEHAVFSERRSQPAAPSIAVG